jgi:hypothetical protein
VSVEVVAEQKRGVVVGRGKEPRRAVVQEVALVDRLETERIPLLGERREDGLVLSLRLGAQRVLPEGALACRLPCDRLPEPRGYNQVASSFVQ